MEAPAGVPTQVRFDAANGEIHHRQPPRRMVRLLTVDCNVTGAPAMREDEPFRLHEHPARSAGGVERTSFIRFEQFDQEPNDRPRRVELAPGASLGTGEAAEKILV